MEALFLAGSVQALFFAVLVFNKKEEKQTADMILGIWLISLSIALLITFLVYNSGTYKYFDLFSVAFFLYACHPVFFYLYTISLTAKTESFNTRLLWHFVTAFVNTALFLPITTLPPDQVTAIYAGIELPPAIVMYFGFPIFLVTNAVYIILALRKLTAHRKDLKYTFSYEESIDLKWLLNLTVTFIVVASLIFILSLLYVLVSPAYALLYDYIVGLTYVGFVFALGYFGYKQGKIFSHTRVYAEEKPEEKKESPKFPEEQSSLEKNALLASQLTSYMNGHKPWLNQKLSLYDLASELNITSHQLTSLLNDYLKTNFYDFINHYRVEEAKKRLSGNNNQYTVLAIAFECGFNSKASFNRIFKQKTGKTPTEYLKVS